MSRALALDCCASAAVEELCDQIELELQGKFPGCFFPYRFSPGYGDLPLEVQGELLHLLDAPRRVGLCANESSLLTPRKSVTAILGISEKELEATPQLPGLSRPGELPVSKGGRTLWTFMSCCGERPL